MGIDFRVRDFFYPLGIYRLRREFERTQWLSPEELSAYQERRLAVIINQAYEHVPYYRSLFRKLGLRPSDIQGTDDLKKLPLLSRDTVRNGGTDHVADNAARYNPVAYKTSGTSGSPLRFYLDRNALILEFVYYWRHWSWAGYRLGDRFVELGSSYFLHGSGLCDKVSSWQPHLCRLMLNSNRISVLHARDMAGAIRKHRPKFLKGTASSVYFMALCFREAGITDLSFRAVFSNGEVLTPQYRAMAEATFHCPVLDSYGHMEGAVAVSQCMEGGYHINSDYGLLEFGDPGDSPETDHTERRVIGTSLHNLAMPFIRYDLGDSVEVSTESGSCPCGRTLPLIRAVRGRSEDIIVTPDGRFITSMFTIPEFVEGVRFMQFVQETETRLYVNVIPDGSCGEKWREELLSCVAKFVGEGMDIRVRKIAEDDIITDASGKVRPVISYVNTGY